MPEPRQVLRLVAVALSAVVAALYAVVGFELVSVRGVTGVEPGPAVPLVIAAFAFAALTAALALRPRPPVYIAGIVLSLVVLIGYVVVAPSRHPPFEAWGLSIKAVEILLLAVLFRLLLWRPVDAPEAAALRRQPPPALETAVPAAVGTPRSVAARHRSTAATSSRCRAG